MFLDEVRAIVPEEGRCIVDMIELLASSADSRGVKRAFLLASEGTIASGIYQDRFGGHGIEVAPASEAMQSELREFIETVKQNKVDAAAKKRFTEFVQGLSENNVILGCTELPLLVDGGIEDVELYDPMQAAIDYVAQAYERANQNAGLAR